MVVIRFVSVLLGLIGLVGVSSLSAAPQPVPLWPEGPPTNNGLTGAETQGGCVGNISAATLTVYQPSDDDTTGAAVLITPGGGYGVVCVETEGRQIANWLTERGVTAVVLKYRLPNGHHGIPSSDARRAIRTIRHRAKEWKIDPSRVGIWGFSAGGHLASTVSTQFDSGSETSTDPIEQHASRPDFSILFYPVISMAPDTTHGGSRRNLLGAEPTDDLERRYSNQLQVTAETPPTFLLHAADDRAVPIKNALEYHAKLVEHSVPARMLVFETGGHGPSAFKSNPSWEAVFESWLKKQIRE